MSSAPVIVLRPAIDDFTGIKSIAEPVLIQEFIAEAAVKALCKSVFSAGLPG
jgi:hypothetical protein